MRDSTPHWTIYHLKAATQTYADLRMSELDPVGRHGPNFAISKSTLIYKLSNVVPDLM